VTVIAGASGDRDEKQGLFARRGGKKSFFSLTFRARFKITTTVL
jgi:hypothetical protein